MHQAQPWEGRDGREQGREGAFKQTTLHLGKKNQFLFLLAFQFPSRRIIISTLLTLPDRNLGTTEKKRAKPSHRSGSPLRHGRFSSSWGASQVSRVLPRPVGPSGPTARDTGLKAVAVGERWRSLWYGPDSCSEAETHPVPVALEQD